MGLSTVTIGKNGYQFGKGGYASYGRIQLPGMASSQGNNNEQMSPAANFRQGILFYFGRLQLASDTQGAVKSSLQGVSETSKVVKSIQEAQRQDWGRNADAMKTIRSTLQETLASTDAMAPAWLKEAAEQAANAIPLTDIAKGMISSLGDMGLPVLGDVKKFATSFADGVKKAWLVINTQAVYGVLRGGSPTLLIQSLHKQLSEDAAVAFAQSAYSIAKGIVTTVTGGASLAISGVVDAVKGFIAYILDLYRNYRDRFALKAFFADCKQKFDTNDPIIFSQQAYVYWLSPVLKELPVVASHCISSALTGSYFGFMTSLGPDGNDIDKNVLQKGYADFGKLKTAAGKYAKNYPVKFSSQDSLVSNCLTILNSGGIDKSDGAAAKSVGWFRRLMMKTGLQKNTLYA